MPKRTFTQPAQTILETLRGAGPVGLSTSDLVAATAKSRRTTFRALEELERLGAVERINRGHLRITRGKGTPALATSSGRKIWKTLETELLTAYVSGLDIIGGHTHQFVMAFPHLVVVLPEHRDTAEFALAAQGFEVRAPGTVFHPDPDRIVLLWSRRGWVAPHYQVRAHVAPPELAWLDLYALARDGRYPIAGGEMGRILQDLRSDPRFDHRLQVLVRRHFSAELGGVLRGRQAAGFAAEVAEGLSS